MCRLDWNKLLPDSCTPSDASSTSHASGDEITSTFRELTAPVNAIEGECVTYRSFDVIVASDIVCCESDAVGVSHTLLNFLKREKLGDEKGIKIQHWPVALFIVPSEFHRLVTDCCVFDCQ